METIQVLVVKLMWNKLKKKKKCKAGILKARSILWDLVSFLGVFDI